MSQIDRRLESLGGYIHGNCLRVQYLREVSGGPEEVDVEAMAARLEVANREHCFAEEKSRLKKGARLSSEPGVDPLLLEKDVLCRLLEWGGEKFEGSVVKTSGYLMDEGHLELFGENDVKVLVAVNPVEAEIEAEQLYTLRKLKGIFGKDVRVELGLTERNVREPEELKRLIVQLAKNGIESGRVMMTPYPFGPGEAKKPARVELRRTLFKLDEFVCGREKLKWEPFSQIKKVVNSGVGEEIEIKKFLNVTPLAQAVVKSGPVEVPGETEEAAVEEVCVAEVVEEGGGWRTYLPICATDCGLAGRGETAGEVGNLIEELVESKTGEQKVAGKLEERCPVKSGEGSPSNCGSSDLSGEFRERLRLLKYPVMSDGAERYMSYRRQNVNQRVTPDVICIGASRCGTTSLWYYLGEHPEVKKTLVKEINFFNRINSRKGGLSWYLSFFPTIFQLARSSDNKLPSTFEATPAYFFNPDAPDRIKYYLPEVKLILMLRDPVDRVYSHYQHISQGLNRENSGNSQNEFSKDIEKELDNLPNDLCGLSWKKIFKSSITKSYLTVRSLYYFQVKNWLNCFPEEQIFFIKSENFFENTIDVLQELCNFLELARPEKRSYDKYHSHDYPDMNDETEEYLRDFFKPYNEKLYELVGCDFGWD